MRRPLTKLKQFYEEKPRFHVHIDLKAPSVAASWPCGCSARGGVFSALELIACPLHLHFAKADA